MEQIKQGREVQIGEQSISNHTRICLIAGPCQLESRDQAFDIAGALQEHTKLRQMPFVFKASFDKANRTSSVTPRGPGLERALEIFSAIRRTLNVAVVTDAHEPWQCNLLAQAVDMIQIPALLCRQTDLLVAAAKTRLPVHVKKGQFLSPWEMQHVVQKIVDAGNEQVLVCERGTTFGYNLLVNDYRGLAIMRQSTGCPVIFDATHSVQRPGGLGDSSGGDRDFAPILARAAVAVGVAGIFAETHPNPDCAPSDGATMIRLPDVPMMLDDLLALDDAIKARMKQIST